jgi:hypothetical protein
MLFVPPNHAGYRTTPAATSKCRSHLPSMPHACTPQNGSGAVGSVCQWHVVRASSIPVQCLPQPMLMTPGAHGRSRPYHWMRHCRCRHSHGLKTAATAAGHSQSMLLLTSTQSSLATLLGMMCDFSCAVLETVPETVPETCALLCLAHPHAGHPLHKGIHCS